MLPVYTWRIWTTKGHRDTVTHDDLPASLEWFLLLFLNGLCVYSGYCGAGSAKCDSAYKTHLHSWEEENTVSFMHPQNIATVEVWQCPSGPPLPMCILRGTMKTCCWFHMPPAGSTCHLWPVRCSEGLWGQAVFIINSFIRMCGSAGQLQLSCSLWVSWQTGLLLRAGNWMALRRTNEPQKMWHSKKRTVLVSRTLCPWSVQREIQCNGLKNILLALISFKW